MRRILSLPPALLSLLTTSISGAVADPQWPYNLPADEKYFPEDEAHIKRGLSALDELGKRRPIGAQKLSDDENEMFFLDYWQFEEQERTLVRRSVELGNVTQGELLPPLLLHSTSTAQSHLSPRWPGANIFKRDFTCPSGTSACTSINRPNSCCGTGESCVIVSDTGLGDVGCCPAGSTCGQSISQCDTSEGYQSCPGSDNGGCCIPDFQCFGIGCIQTTNLGTTTTTAPTVTITSCRGGYFSCPASLGGGCCQNGAICGSSTTCIFSTSTPSSTPTTTVTTTPTTTVAVGAPVRPTGTSEESAPPPSTTSEEEATTPRTTTVGTEIIGVCPTNFYFCSAYYRPGCCRIGRDCALSNCPAAASSSAVVSNGVTILVPVGPTTGGSTYQTTALITSEGDVSPSTTAGPTGRCQGGWQSCGQDVGGGCCPEDFACGTSCTATANGQTGLVSKLPASAGVPAFSSGWSLGILAALITVGMIW